MRIILSAIAIVALIGRISGKDNNKIFVFRRKRISSTVEEDRINCSDILRRKKIIAKIECPFPATKIILAATLTLLTHCRRTKIGI